jgi:hypothetical protein
MQFQVYDSVLFLEVARELLYNRKGSYCFHNPIVSTTRECSSGVVENDSGRRSRSVSTTRECSSGVECSQRRQPQGIKMLLQVEPGDEFISAEDVRLGQAAENPEPQIVQSHVSLFDFKP